MSIATDEIANSLIHGFMDTQDSKFLDELNQLGPSVPHWHIEMLTDRRRLEYYRDIFAGNMKGKIVLDIGAGSGILSYLAYKAGAEKVFAVEHDPVMQEVFHSFLKDPIKEGKIELFCKDAQNLRLEDFGDQKPTTIIHEIFGHNGISELVIEVFSSLHQHGILQGTELYPQKFQLIVQPVECQKLEENFELSDFEGYPIKMLAQFGEWSSKSSDYRESTELAPKPVGPEVTVVDCDLRNPDIQTSYSSKLSFESKATHLMAWLRLESHGKVLESSHLKHYSHWHNQFFHIPKWHQDKPNLEAQFEVLQRIIHLTGLK